ARDATRGPRRRRRPAARTGSGRHTDSRPTKGCDVTDPQLTDGLRELLSAPNPCVMATLRKDGSPVSVATWYLLDDDRIRVNLDADRVRLQHLRRDPRVAMTILSAESWYSHVSIQGRLASITHAPDLPCPDSLAPHYTGEKSPRPSSPRVAVRIDIERLHTSRDPAALCPPRRSPAARGTAGWRSARSWRPRPRPPGPG